MGKALATNLDTKIEQVPGRTIPPLGEELQDDDRERVTTPAGGYTPKEDQRYMSDLAFMEEPVTIIIQGSAERSSFNCTDMISVNGRKAEVLVNNKWLPFGHLPKGRAFVTKRKYLDTIIRSKSDQILTETERMPDNEVMNKIGYNTYAMHTVTLLEDKNPYGREWFQRRMASNY